VLSLLDPDRALSLVLEIAPEPQPERRRVADAVGRILLEPVKAVVAQSPFTKSMMDGTMEETWQS
jgi:molybdopterin biosynthesis enzyme